MRALSFAGFLKSYLLQLSMAGTTNLYKLVKEAAEKSPRLREPLLLYAMFTDKTDVLLRAAKPYLFVSEYRRITEQFNKGSMLLAFQSVTGSLPEEYKKVWNSYLYQKNRLQNDNHTKDLMHKRVVELQNVKGLSNYRLYTDLGLNPGNFNAWLKHGDQNKVSLDTARRVLTYLENLPQVRL